MNQKYEIEGIDIEWRKNEGLCLWAGAPVMTAWIESTMAGFLATIERMVGTERFMLGMQQGGRDSIDGDWAVISAAPTFEEGFVALSNIAAAAGWGRWELVSVDKAALEARVRIYNNWEAIAQRALGVSWGSNFVARFPIVGRNKSPIQPKMIPATNSSFVPRRPVSSSGSASSLRRTMPPRWTWRERSRLYVVKWTSGRRRSSSYVKNSN